MTTMNKILYPHATLCLTLVFSLLKADAQMQRGITISTPDTSVTHLHTNGAYSGWILTDGVFYDNQLSFINRDTAIFFLDDDASRLSQIPCATFYRKAPLNKYYQPDGFVTDYYLDNDAIAAQLSYKAGKLDGPCAFYYKNKQLREKGNYANNARVGIWDYYYPTGRKAKTIRFTDTGSYLIDCFMETGAVLAQNGNGRFEGLVVTGTLSRPLPLRMSGTIKDGVPDGEWKLYNTFQTDPLMTEQFSAGKFLGGSNNAFRNTDNYDQKTFSTVESVHPEEATDYYGDNNVCALIGKKQFVDARDMRRMNPYADLGKVLGHLLKSGKYDDYSGWVLLDIHYNRHGRILDKSVRLYQENAAFKADLLKMIDHMQTPAEFYLDGKNVSFEKFYVILIEANQLVIPEQLLEKQREPLIQRP